MPGTAGEVRKNSRAIFFDGFRYMDTQMLANQHLLCADTGYCLENLPRAIDR